MERASIEINGIVQGVGFRPFIHRLVRRFGLNGHIENSPSGVELELEGEREALEAFVAALPNEAPKLAMIDTLSVRYSAALRRYRGFEIRGSKTEELRRTLISPDLGVCEDCRRELLDPGDRRYRYPFINCTNCGPRFTILEDLPYDRARTTMSGFPMCPACAREYGDIENRRYHAQPNCCPVCGPRVFYLDAAGRELPGDAIVLAQDTLAAGGIVAVKGLGGVHLACRGDDGAAVMRLRRRKGREEKPLAVMCRDLDAARRLCVVSDGEAAVLQSVHKPIVLLKKRDGAPDALSENGELGVMLPYTPLHLLLTERFDCLVMTSANLADTPVLTDNDEALRALSGLADGFLLHDRPIRTRCDDSLCRVLDGEEYFIRRSRGYVPYPIRLSRPLRPILACGAEQKATFCLSRGDFAFPSQHIGDLKNAETYAHYTAQIRHFERLFDVSPTLLVCDTHPDYLSSAYAAARAEKEKLPLLQVQHHHAHLAACLADNGLDGPVIGLIWDGVGLGEDGTAWGGECLVGDFHGFRRLGSIRPIPLIGGDLAARELDRLAYALLRESGCETGAIPAGESYGRLLDAGLNCPPSSGMGRLFDGVAAILGLKHRAAYEGQGAALLESAATPTEESYTLRLAGEPLRFDWREMIRAMAADRDAGLPRGEIAGRFHNTLIEMGLRQCRAAREQSGLTDVALSGGCFQNMLLLKGLTAALERDGFHVWRHRRVSCTDEGLALGQVMIAAARLNDSAS